MFLGALVDRHADLAETREQLRTLIEAYAARRSPTPGDYLEADGEKQDEALFHADSVDIKHHR